MTKGFAWQSNRKFRSDEILHQLMHVSMSSNKLTFSVPRHAKQANLHKKKVEYGVSLLHLSKKSDLTVKARQSKQLIIYELCNFLKQRITSIKIDLYKNRFVVWRNRSGQQIWPSISPIGLCRNGQYCCVGTDDATKNFSISHVSQ